MVGHRVAYGIALTDEFGGEYFQGIKNVIENFDGKNGEPDWISSFPSVEDDQLVLGFSIHLNKKIDISAIQKQWDVMYESVPQEIKEILGKYEEEEADFHIMSGSY